MPAGIPIEAIRDISRANRKIGLGVMGFAHMLIKLGIPYDSDEAVTAARDLMGFIDNRIESGIPGTGHRTRRIPQLQGKHLGEKGHPLKKCNDNNDRSNRDPEHPRRHVKRYRAHL